MLPPMNSISSFVKFFLAAIAFSAMGIGIAGIWGYADADTAAKSIGTLGLIGITVYVVDSVIYRK
jgi:hypothetical protein